MKRKYILWVIIVLGVFYGLLYLWNQRNKEDVLHPTLSSLALSADNFLKNVQDYEEKERHDISSYNLERAIQSIWQLESDVDKESFERLEKVVDRLEEIHRHIIRDSVSTKDLQSAFEFALTNLAHAELEIAEMYAETNKMGNAKAALKYAQVHIKNAMLYFDPYWSTDSTQLVIEKKLFLEMDSLLEHGELTPVEYTVALDEIIKQLDEIIKK